MLASLLLFLAAPAGMAAESREVSLRGRGSGSSQENSRPFDHKDSDSNAEDLIDSYIKETDKHPAVGDRQSRALGHGDSQAEKPRKHGSAGKVQSIKLQSELQMGESPTEN